jgi:AcrR family transcriptional regulator
VRSAPRRRPRPARVASALRRAGSGPETRERLLAAGLELFAEHGFHKVTVRDISHHAEANLAAVSYHFGDKFGLYGAIVEAAIAMMRAFNDTSVAPAELSAEARLRHYVMAYAPRIARPEGKAASIQKLMRHEMHEPTPLARRVIDQGIMPRLHYLSQVIAEMLECPVDDGRVQLCVMSVQAQCLSFARDRFRSHVLKTWPPVGEQDLARAAAHVADFSIAGIRALALTLTSASGRKR